jgi:hypothetical protein
MNRTTVRAMLAGTALAIVALTASACGGSTEPAAEAADGVTEVAAGSLTAGDAVPAPAAADVVLSITGGATSNVGSELRLTLADLASMHTVEADVYEPFLKRRVRFRGVPLADVLALAGAPDGATALDTVALNEYAVTLPLDVLRHPGAIVATQADGAAIPVDDGGPTRVIFTDDHPDTRDESLWIWSLATVRIR